MNEATKTTVQGLEHRRSFRFQSRLVWTGAMHASAAVDCKPDLQVSSPVEFKGDSTCWSPEDMLVAATNACLLWTLLAYARREQLDVVTYQSSATGTLSFVNGRYRFAEVILRPHLTLKTEDDAEIARMLIEEAHRDCIITNSITASVTVEPEIDFEGEIESDAPTVG